MLLTGKEMLHGVGANGGTALDFWRWAFSDIKGNTLRGIFAEWLVAQLLGLPPKSRIEWDSYDLLSPNGVKIEVKSAAYLQAWHSPECAPSRLSFGRLLSRKWENTGGHSATPTCNADIYIFCVNIEKRHSHWDAFDINQWRFYVLDRSEIIKINQRSLGIGMLRSRSLEMDAPSFQQYMKELMARLSLPDKG